jgi:tRNA A-37 threonylcarbamoyl transferase component Bud32
MADIGTSPTQRATEPKPAADGERLEAGVRAGEYEIVRFLGAGAMGEVYEVRHPEIGKRAALKVLKSSLSQSAEAEARFRREARVVNTIEHPNVIDVFAFDRLPDGRRYLLMDLVDGKTLRERIVDGPLDVATALDILEQIADALDAAHAKGVVHRDLKPDNVMLAGTKVFVLDFGIAKLLSTAESPQSMLTGQGAWIGTPGYMAPEQWSADGAGPASDRYALAVMAYELLSGKLPFQAPSLPQMMEAHFRAAIPSLVSRNRFDPVLAKGMAKDPDKRYASAKDFVAALRAASGGKLSRSVGGPRRLWLPAVVAAGALGLAVTGVLFARHKPERDADAPRAAGDFIDFQVRSIPPRATVMRGDRMLGTTPYSFDAHPGEQLQLSIKKPGYATEQKTVVPSEQAKTLDVVLVQVNGFEGTWVLPDGQIRAFQRSSDEHVDVFKLTALDARKEFYRKFLLEDDPAGIKFSSTETVIDQRAPAEPSCQVPVRVEYVYDPKADTLTVRPESVDTGFQDGRCVVESRELVQPIALVRADRSGEVRTSHAPVGIPIDQPRLNVSDADRKRQLLLEEKLKGQKAPPAPPSRKKQIRANVDKPVPPVASKQIPPPQKDPVQANPPPQQQAQQNLGNAQGDSQVAPQVKK